MLFSLKKPEKKKCHPCITIGLCAVTAVGVAVIMSKGTCMIKEKVNEMSKFVKNGWKCETQDTSLRS